MEGGIRSQWSEETFGFNASPVAQRLSSAAGLRLLCNPFTAGERGGVNKTKGEVGRKREKAAREREIRGMLTMESFLLSVFTGVQFKILHTGREV